MIATPITIDVPLRTDDHGIIRVGGTKVRLEQIVHAFYNGESAEGILEMYDVLRLAEIYAVIAYYLEHRTEVDAYVKIVEEREAQILRELEVNASADTLAFRARLRNARDEMQRSKP